MKNQYQEKVTIILRSEKLHSRAELHKWLLRKNYKSEDDFYYMKRKDRPESWQSTTLLSVDIFFRDRGIYETKEDIQEGVSTSWDCLKIDYLIAFVPREQIYLLVEEVEKISVEFNLSVELDSMTLNSDALRVQLQKVADDLECCGGAGSKTLAILIMQQY